MFLPAQLASAQGWVLADYSQKWSVSQPSAAGVAIAVIATVPQDELWLLDRFRVSNNSTQTTAAYVCLDDITRDVDGTSSGNYDIADEMSPIHAPGGSQILMLWAGGSDGSVGTVYMQWTVLRRTLETSL